MPVPLMLGTRQALQEQLVDNDDVDNVCLFVCFLKNVLYQDLRLSLKL